MFLVILSGTQLFFAAQKVVVFWPSISMVASFFNSFQKKSPYAQIESPLARAPIFFLQIHKSVVIQGSENPGTILRVLPVANGIQS